MSDMLDHTFTLRVCLFLAWNFNSFTLILCVDSKLSWNFKHLSGSSTSSSQDVTRIIPGLRSKTECARACASSYHKDELCQSFRFRESTGTCELLKSLEQGSADEWSTYKVGHFELLTHTTPSDDVTALKHFKSAIPGGLKKGMTIHINGDFIQPFDSYTVRLFAETNGRTDLVFLISVRWYGEVAFNSLIGSWGAQESSSQFPFDITQGFEISIVAELSRFQVFAEGQHLAYFTYRYTPIEDIVRFDADGDGAWSRVQVK